MVCKRLRALMRDLAGFAVSYRGLLFNAGDDEFSTFPAQPVIQLVD
jgi:hypothetical protein